VFGDEYPRFMEVSELTQEPDPKTGRARRRGRSAEEQRNRMNERFEALFASNRDVFEGARVLDLASHDGRYSFAALRTGAVHVTGIEVRQSLVDRAQETFRHYVQDPDTYRFVCGDIFEVLARERFEVDVVLCLGFLYHTYRHTELLYRLHQLRPCHLLVDTMVVPGNRSLLRLRPEWNSEDLRSAAQDRWSIDQVLVLWPTVPALRVMLKAYGFDVESMYDWKGHLAGRPGLVGLEGYQQGRRVTVRCRGGADVDAVAFAQRLTPRPAARKAPAPPPPTPPQPTHVAGKGWRDTVNQALAKVTGYQLTRTSRR
jgi:hypothetical protein